MEWWKLEDFGLKVEVGKCQVKLSSYSPQKYKIAPLYCLVRVVRAAGKIEPPWCKVVRESKKYSVELVLVFSF